MNNNNLLAVGWDVGGWMGSNHGFSILNWNYEKKEYSWLGKSVELKIPDQTTFSLDYIFKKVTEKNNFKIDDYDLVIGIDAPLAFPREFKHFINDRKKIFKRPEKQIFSC